MHAPLLIVRSFMRALLAPNCPFSKPPEGYRVVQMLPLHLSLSKQSHFQTYHKVRVCVPVIALSLHGNRYIVSDYRLPHLRVREDGN